MITPKERAKQLVELYNSRIDDNGLPYCLNYSNAIHAARTAAEEILLEVEIISNLSGFSISTALHKAIEYWHEVIIEIGILNNDEKIQQENKRQAYRSLFNEDMPDELNKIKQNGTNENTGANNTTD